MKPPPFEYHAPNSLAEALDLLDGLGNEAKVLAGGQSLMPMLNMRLVRPQHVIDINGLTEYAYIRPSSDLTAIGALTRHRTLERSQDIAARSPLLAEATALIGDRQIRFRGTIGGSLAHADPVAELPLAAMVLDAKLVLASRAGSRTLAIQDFFVGPLLTALEPDELLLEVRVPRLAGGTGTAFYELARQHGAFAMVSAAAAVTLEGGRVSEARIALGGAAPTPVRAHSAEESLRGQQPTSSQLHEAARLAAEATDPASDVHGTASYRRKMASVCAGRALMAAVDRAINITGQA